MPLITASGAVFTEGASFRGTRLSGAICDHALFEGDLRGSRWVGAEIPGAKFFLSDIAFARFECLRNMDRADFTEVRNAETAILEDCYTDGAFLSPKMTATPSPKTVEDLWGGVDRIEREVETWRANDGGLTSAAMSVMSDLKALREALETRDEKTLEGLSELQGTGAENEIGSIARQAVDLLKSSPAPDEDESLVPGQ